VDWYDNARLQFTNRLTSATQKNILLQKEISMKRHFLRTALATALIAATGALPSIAQAQAWPNKPVKAVIHFTPGSATDIVGRTVMEVVSRQIGQPIVIENVPGAGGTIGANKVAKSEPDGYNFLIVSSAISTAPAIYKTLPYDTFADLAPVSPLAALANVVVSPPGRFKTLRELVAKAQSKPDAISYGTAGVGSGTHLNAVKLGMVGKFEGVHVPFKGTPEPIAEVMAGRLDYYAAPVSASITMIKDNKIQALAVSSPKRHPLLPDVPTTAEAGLPGSEFQLWFGVFAPAKTPADVIARMNTEIQKALNSAEIKERFSKQGYEAMFMTSAEFGNYLKAEVDVAKQIVGAAKIPQQ
jgi:tripartite-type tricarboxylate transporter receptor subunit TctC